MGSGAPRPDEAEGQHGQQQLESSAWCNDKCQLEVTAEGGQLRGETNLGDSSAALLDGHELEAPTASPPGLQGVRAANGDRLGSARNGLEGGKEASGQPSGLAGRTCGCQWVVGIGGLQCEEFLLFVMVVS
eukprot:s2720_g5.t1